MLRLLAVWPIVGIFAVVFCFWLTPSASVALAVGVLVGGLLSLADWYASRDEGQDS